VIAAWNTKRAPVPISRSGVPTIGGPRPGPSTSSYAVTSTDTSATGSTAWIGDGGTSKIKRDVVTRSRMTLTPHPMRASAPDGREMWRGDRESESPRQESTLGQTV
jgi:hypothetical protein